jgi:hypothetical protein
LLCHNGTGEARRERLGALCVYGFRTENGVSGFDPDGHNMQDRGRKRDTPGVFGRKVAGRAPAIAKGGGREHRF